jgi:hypothetical protein
MVSECGLQNDNYSEFGVKNTHNSEPSFSELKS